jgi:hypothetical protein
MVNDRKKLSLRGAIVKKQFHEIASSALAESQ